MFSVYLMAQESLHGDRLLPVGSELGPVVGHLLTVVQQTSGKSFESSETPIERCLLSLQ